VWIVDTMADFDADDKNRYRIFKFKSTKTIYR